MLMNYKKIGVFLIVLIVFNIIFFNVFYNGNISESKSVNLIKDKLGFVEEEKINVQEESRGIDKKTENKEILKKVSKKDITGKILNVNQEKGFASENINLLAGMLYSDNFNRPDEPLGTSLNWNVLAGGNINVKSQAISTSQVGTSYALWVQDPLSIDYYVQATSLPPFNPDVTNSGVILRYVDANNYYSARANLGLAPMGSVTLYKVKNGVQTVLGQYGLGNTIQFPAIIRLSAQGNELTITIDPVSGLIQDTIIDSDPILAVGNGGFLISSGPGTLGDLILDDWEIGTVGNVCGDGYVDPGEVCDSNLEYQSHFNDDFDRANSDNLGTNWTEVVGDIDVNNNWMRAGAQLSNRNIALLNHSSYLGIHNSTQTVNCLDMDNGDQCGLIARYVNESNYYLLFVPSTYNVLNLTKVVANTTTILNTTYTLAGTDDISLVVNGTNLSVYTKGVLKASVIDTDLQNDTSFIGVYLKDSGFGVGTVNLDSYNISSDTVAICTTSDGYTGTQNCLVDCSGFSCTSNAYCGDGMINGPEVCDDGTNNGQLGFCNIQCTGLVECLSDVDCDNNNFCNGIETCNLATFTCVSGTPIDCSGLNDQCNIGVCNPLDGSCFAEPILFSFADDFNRANGVLGSNWLLLSGVWDIVGDKAHTNVGGSIAVWNDQPATADYFVQGTLTGGGALNWRSGIGGRILDENNGYYVFGEEGQGLVQLRKETSGGGITQLASWTGVTFPAAVRLTLVSNLLTVTINGEEKAPILDSSISLPGYVGLWSEGGFNSEGFVDDWSAGGTLLTCNDGISCTVNDQCNLAGGCNGVPDNSLCNNGLFCDGVESCDPVLGCQSGTLVDCSANNLNPVATCANNPDNVATTWDLFQGFTSSCDENIDSCTTGSIILTHSCNIVQCGAQCETNFDCGNYCSGEVYFYGGICQVDCSCSYTNEDCNLNDGWYDTGVLQWVDIDSCNEKEQKEQDYRDYTCDVVGCEYFITQKQFVDTGNTRAKTDGTLCNDGLFCNGVESCQVGVCAAGISINCNDGVSCTNDVCDEGIDINDNLGQCVNSPDNLLCNDGVSCTNDVCDLILGCQNPEIDNDLDMYSICPGPNQDCNDNNPPVNPGAIEICTDSIDNNCNNECDYDTSMPCTLHGDVACPVGVTSISVSDITPLENINIEIKCTSDVANVNSIQAFIDTDLCIFDRWEVNDAVFICNVGLPGTKIAKCTVDTTKSYQTPPDRTMILKVLSSDCSIYPNEAECLTVSSICEWCVQCQGTLSSGAVDSCVDIGNCGNYICRAGECSAVCDASVGCAAIDCDYLDGCVGNDYYDYNDVSNACLSNCNCENNVCGIPVIYANDARCTQCQTDVDCDDGNLCTIDNCVSGVCGGIAVSCNDNNVCNGLESCDSLLGCQSGIPLDCDDGLFCDGVESCDAILGCQNGFSVDCSANNILINTCFFNPDNIDFTLDAYSFTSSCDEFSDSCTNAPINWQDLISHVCNIETCGAECADGNLVSSDGCSSDCRIETTTSTSSSSTSTTSTTTSSSTSTTTFGPPSTSSTTTTSSTSTTVVIIPPSGGSGGGTRLKPSGIRYACNDGEDNDEDGYCDLKESTCIDGSIPGDHGCYSIFDDNETNFIEPPYLQPPEMCKVCWGNKDLSNLNVLSEFFNYQDYFNNIYQSNNIECCECNYNSRQDLGEEGIDCGGVCPKCAATKVVWPKFQISVWLMVLVLVLLIFQFFVNKLNKLSAFLVGVYILSYVSLRYLALNFNLLNILGGAIVIYQLYILSKKREIFLL